MTLGWSLLLLFKEFGTGKIMSLEEDRLERPIASKTFEFSC